jgi:hypothetical protein
LPRFALGDQLPHDQQHAEDAEENARRDRWNSIRGPVALA